MSAQKEFWESKQVLAADQHTPDLDTYGVKRCSQVK